MAFLSNDSWYITEVCLINCRVIIWCITQSVAHYYKNLIPKGKREVERYVKERERERERMREIYRMMPVDEHDLSKSWPVT